MNTRENKEFIEEIFRRLAAGDTRALSEAMADDCRWVFPGHWSWAGSREPKSEVLNGLLRPLMAQFDGNYRSEADLVLADGDRVVVQARGHAITTRGDRYDQTYCYVFRISAGRIAEVVEHCDTALVERVLQPIPPVRRDAG
ncbi:nuclear transport factor 2 family protein [Nocardia sp. alder85J]|uniref:nuclear transport factor 2 family protein n=1 Tax=Nocardia sp. alder85J TaxID=2862949 RepID=UPI001CD1A262|nr:nuclear transport factor 2 family protein [Nocardia sp. alder85J]MCX4098568.1 nuclear transport factor 2 family protein [Nocardia sp. alder85J]